MNDGFVKIAAESKDKDNYKSILSHASITYTYLVSILTLVVIILGFVFSDKITIYIFGEEKYLKYYFLSLASLPILIMNSVSFALLKSHKAMNYISRANIISSITGLVIFIPLIYYLRITGAVISIVINYIILFILNNYHARTKVLSKINLTVAQIFKGKYSKLYAKTLINFALFGIIAGSAQLFSEFFTRSLLVTKFGVDKIGIYSPIISWVGMLRGIFLPSLSTYLYPRLCEVKSNLEIKGILNDVIRLSTFILIPFIFLGISMRSLLIPLLYSPKFIEATKYLPYHFLGTVFFFWWYCIALVLTPTGRIRIHGFFMICMAITDILVVFFLLPELGMYGWMLKFIISPFIFFFVYMIFLNRHYGFKIYIRNIMLMSYLMLGIIIILLYESKYSNNFILFEIIVALVLTSGVILFLSANEKNIIQTKIKYFLKL